MSAEIVDAGVGLVTIKITGKLRKSELDAAQKNAAEIIRKRGGSQLLVLAEKFEGWERSGDWGDLSAQTQLDEHIEKIAIVGEKRWEDVALLFTGKGARKVEIEYFAPTELTRARSWLSSARQRGN